MTDAIRVLVTGSRVFGALHVIETALSQIDVQYREGRIVLAHGRCDPRGATGKHWPVPWDDALRESPERQMGFVGADWLCDRVATRLGWGIEAFPADWKTHPKTGGMIRNSKMVATAPGMARAFFAGGEPNRGTIDCAGKAVAAGIATLCFCDMCASPRLHPCRNHSLEAVVLAWEAASLRGRQKTRQPTLTEASDVV